MDLQKKQDYYRYGDGRIEFKTPPVLRDDVRVAMEHYKLNEDYRFLWMGVDIVRRSDTDPHPIVRGDPRACEVVLYRISHMAVSDGVLTPRIQPRKLYARMKYCVGFEYWDKSMRAHHASRLDKVPGDAVSTTAVFEYHDFGALEWRIERRIVGQQVVDAHLFPPGQEPKEHWFCIETIKSPEGFYQEPCMLHVFELRKRQWEDKNADLREVALRDAQLRDELQAEAAFKESVDERIASNIIVDDALSHAERQPVSVS